MPITVRQEISTSGTGANLTLTTGAGTLTTDLLLLVQADDFATLANSLTPTGTAASSWTQQYTIDGGTNHDHLKVWTAPVTSAGAKTVIASWTSTAPELYEQLFVLTGAAGVDGFASTQPGSSSTSFVAPTVTPLSGQTDDLLICFFGGGDAGSVQSTETVPGGMTGCTQQLCGGSFFGARCAYQQLASAAATGTRTSTASPAQPYTTASILVKASAGAATTPTQPIIVAASPAAIRSATW